MKKFKELAEQIGLYEDEHTFGGGVQNPSATPREISATSDEGAFKTSHNLVESMPSLMHSLVKSTSIQRAHLQCSVQS